MKLNKVIEFTAYAVGGVSLFLVSFLVFALSAGIPAHEVALVGGLFPETEAVEVADGEGVEGARPKHQSKTPEQVLQATIGRLDTVYTAPSPFDDEEVEQLVTDLRAQKLEYEQLIDALKERELALDDRESVLDEQAELLQELKGGLDSQQAAIALARQELERDEKVADERKAAIAKNKASFYANEEAAIETLAQKLGEVAGRDMDEAALILSNLEDERAQALLLAMDGTKADELRDAWASLGL